MQFWFSIVHKSADRPVAANFQFLKISVSLGQLPVGACPPQALLGSSTANWKLSFLYFLAAEVLHVYFENLHSLSCMGNFLIN